uniref:YvlB/LiaX N-terminal domain-containing protein n=1 Tax=Fervidobacterium thailandense TaxID=1008305 RepID=A0A7C4GJA6_9BACT
MELRKILEAVENGELSPEDGEKLINALFESSKEDFGQSKVKELYNEVFVVKPGEIIRETVSARNSKLTIEGEILGDLDVVNCYVELSGTVHGNLNAATSKISWRGGRVLGDARLVMCQESGNGYVFGKKNGVAVDLPFIKGVIEEDYHDDSVTKEEMVLNGDFETEEIKDVKLIRVVGNVRAEKLHCEKLIVSGKLHSQSVSCEHLEIQSNASLSTQKLWVEELKNDGKLDVKKCTAEIFENNGDVSCETLVCERLGNNGMCRLQSATTEELENNGSLTCDVLTTELLLNRGNAKIRILTAESVENYGKLIAELASYETYNGIAVEQHSEE